MGTEDEAEWSKMDANGASMAALREAEARGYARGIDVAAKIFTDAEARGFERSIEQAAKLCEERARGWSILRSMKMTYWAEAAEVLAAEIRDLPKPKAGA